MSKRSREEEGDEDEDDEDYDPEKDKEEERERLADEAEARVSTKGATEGSVINSIKEAARNRRVDALWDQMKADERNTPLKESAAAASIARKKKKKTSTGSRKTDRKSKQLLASIFGNAVARDICAKTTTRRGGGFPRGAPTEPASASAAPSSVLRKVTVTEVGRFAGRTVEVTRTVLRPTTTGTGTGTGTGTPSAADTQQQPPRDGGGAGGGAGGMGTGGETEAGPTGSGSAAAVAGGEDRASGGGGHAVGLDAALSAMGGPVKMNTVTKSSLDWESYKDEAGLSGDLEQAAKDGFLAKREFLERCDVRQFEKERDTRLLKAKK